MSYLTFDNKGIIFHDAAAKPHRLINHLNNADNQSDLSQADLINGVQNNLQRLFDNTTEGMVRLIIFLRIVARLMRKPQTHHVLHIGQWSSLDEVLATLLPQFNGKNSLWCYSPTRPVGKFGNVNFIFAEVNGDGHYIPTNTFDTIIFAEPKIPSLEVLLAVKDFGQIYFAAPKSSLPDYLTTPAQMFDLDKNFSVIELELSPTFKQELLRHTPQGQLEDNKDQIKQTVYKMKDVAKKFNTLSPQDKNACLDEYIAELTRTEKILNEIFPQLHSDTIKLNFNMFKEFLIDVRLYTDWQLKNRAVEDLNRQTQILLQDLNNL